MENCSCKSYTPGKREGLESDRVLFVRRLTWLQQRLVGFGSGTFPGSIAICFPILTLTSTLLMPDINALLLTRSAIIGSIIIVGILLVTK